MRRGQVAKADRRGRAELLAEKRSRRTAEQQLGRLDQLLGKGKGAKKERARLAKEDK